MRARYELTLEGWVKVVANAGGLTCTDVHGNKYEPLRDFRGVVKKLGKSRAVKVKVDIVTEHERVRVVAPAQLTCDQLKTDILALLGKAGLESLFVDDTMGSIRVYRDVVPKGLNRDVVTFNVTIGETYCWANIPPPPKTIVRWEPMPVGSELKGLHACLEALAQRYTIELKLPERVAVKSVPPPAKDAGLVVTRLQLQQDRYWVPKVISGEPVVRGLDARVEIVSGPNPDLETFEVLGSKEIYVYGRETCDQARQVVATALARHGVAHDAYDGTCFVLRPEPKKEPVRLFVTRTDEGGVEEKC